MHVTQFTLGEGVTAFKDAQRVMWVTTRKVSSKSATIDSHSGASFNLDAIGLADTVHGRLMSWDVKSIKRISNSAMLCEQMGVKKAASQLLVTVGTGDL